MCNSLPVLALTMGDPAGIGPELIAKAVAEKNFAGRMKFVLYGSEDVLKKALQTVTPAVEYSVLPTCSIKNNDFKLGEAAAICGQAAYDTVKAACLACLDGSVDAMVTAPVNKYAVNLAGIEFTGHTELIAELCQVDDFAMMQSAGQLHVVFVTTHIALKDVPEFATAKRIEKVTHLLNEVLREENIPSPRIAMAAINPHAGENGCMGTEDENVVKPTIALLKSQGLDITGPFPPDTLFIASTLNKFDGVVSMYHDQGHIPFKMLAFDRGVNSTLGLPIIRTSPDHGTAFEIAGKNLADPGSFFAAIELAAARASYRKAARG